MALYRFAEPLSVAACLAKAQRRASVLGDAGRLVLGVAALDQAEPGALCFCSAEPAAAAALVAASPAAAIIVKPGLALGADVTAARTVIVDENPMRLFIACLDAMFPAQRKTGISPGAQVAASARVDAAAWIAPGSVVEADCTIGARSEVHSGAKIYPKTRIGNDVLVQSNAVLGATGLAFGEEADRSYAPMPHLAGVVIGDGVAIGASTVIVSGILTDTEVGEGTKIGNLVNVGHNVKIGRHCFISSGATLCGSAVLEDHCWIAAGAIVGNHVRIGAGARVTLGAVVTRDVARGATVAGMPARALPGG